MATEAWTVDGVALSDKRFFVQTYNGLDDVAPTVGTNTLIPYKSGSIWNHKVFGEGQITFAIIVLGQDPTTGVPGANQTAQRTLVDAGLDILTKVFGQRHRLLTFVRTFSDGTTRQTYGEVITTISVNQFGINNAQFTVTVLLPMPFLEDGADQTYTSPLGTGVPGTTYTPSQFSAGTAPMEDLVLTAIGPITNPKFTDIASGYYCQYTGAVTAAQTLIINAKVWTVTSTGGLTVSYANFAHTGQRFFTLTPDQLTGAQLKMDGTSATSATGFTVVGRRRYLR